MKNSEMKRLIKIENRIYQIVEEMGFDFCPIEFDVIPPQKMIEMMAYIVPGNISNWRYGRDYERIRTMYEKSDYNLPYEVVVNTDPVRAYLMKDNTFAVQALVMSHVLGHVVFFTMNKYFQNTDRYIITVLSEASKRFNKYERLYGIDIVEKTVDAAHSIMLHSSPYNNEIESEKRLRIFEQLKKKHNAKPSSEFGDLLKKKEESTEDSIDLFNRKLWLALKGKTPVEPTEDFLRYIIDNSQKLDDWQKDVCEIVRQLGIYLYPQIRSKFSNEGLAVFFHEKIMDRLFKEEYLNKSDHAQYNFSNSLVKAKSPLSLNPYLIGSEIFYDIEDRWNKGKFGKEYENLTNVYEKENWDKKLMKGMEKVKEVVRVTNDWFFMKEFLTPELVNKIGLYIYMIKDSHTTEDFVITKHKAKEIADMIITSFVHNGIPKIKITNGDYNDKGTLQLEHEYAGAPLEPKYCEETLKHICFLWGKNVILKTKADDNKNQYYSVDYEKMATRTWKD